MIGIGALSSIRQKLLLFFVITSSVALLLACSAFVVYDVIAFRQILAHDLGVVADGIGINSSAALTFEDPKSAQDILAALQAYPNVVSADIFDGDGRVFASYSRNDLLAPLAAAEVQPAGYEFRDRNLLVYRQVLHDGDLLGTVFIRSDMEQLKLRLRRYALIVAIVIAVALVVAYLLASRLEGRISGPILRLAELESRVWQEKDYSLRAKKETEDEVGTLIEGFNQMLVEIERRDAELRTSNQELNVKNREILLAQTKLVQSEKMASLGQLVAGVAHEINNPINFISSGLPALRRDVDKLAGMVPESAREAIFGKITQRAAKLLDAIEDGARRTAEIVTNLRTFSRLDEAAFKTADVHQALDSTLRLLNSKTQDRVEVVRRYGDLPPIDCYISQLNQVFMNILVNAIQAIEGNGTITVTTSRLDGDRVQIAIRDSGSGMSEEVRRKIFDPFFTTKDVGSGTGLGLSISHGIIERHQGRVEVESAIGSGTEFRIILPVHPVPVEPSQSDKAGTAPAAG